jgi:hypothetical protein
LAEGFVLVAVLDLEDPDLGGAGGGERFLDHVAAGGGEAELAARLAGAGEPDGVALKLALGAGQLRVAGGVTRPEVIPFIVNVCKMGICVEIARTDTFLANSEADQNDVPSPVILTCENYVARPAVFSALQTTLIPLMSLPRPLFGRRPANSISARHCLRNAIARRDDGNGVSAGAEAGDAIAVDNDVGHCNLQALQSAEGPGCGIGLYAANSFG